MPTGERPWLFMRIGPPYDVSDQNLRDVQRSGSIRITSQTPHFKKYKAVTQAMVKSLKLIEAEPILLGRK